MSWDGNGIGDYLQIINDARLRWTQADHCYGVWVRRDGNSNLGNSGPVFAWNTAGAAHQLWVRNSTAPSDANKIRYLIRDSIPNEASLTSTQSIVNDTWTHILVQKSGNTQEMYINGVLETSADASAVNEVDPGVNPLLFSFITGAGDRFNGQLAEFFKFDRALTSTEITDIAGGMRPTELRGALEQLAIFLPMDEDPIVTANMRDYHNRYVLSHAGIAINTNHPDIYDPRPTVKTYYEQSTHRKVQFTGNTELDVTKETPYGIHEPQTDSISNAVNWCLKYQREPDPALRVPAGGPEGCFTPKIPACGYDDYWLADEPFFNPNKWGNALIGERVSGNPNDVYGSNSNGCSRVRFSLTDKNIPCIINQGQQFVMENLAIMADSTEQVGLLNHKMVVNESGTLTTRTSDTAGIITLSSAVSGQGPVTGERIQIRWAGGVRHDAVVSAIGGSSTIYTFSGGSGDVLPAQDTAVTIYDWCYVPTNAEGYGTGVDGSQPNSRFQGTNTIWDGFSVAAIQNAAYANVSNCDHHTMIKTYFNNCARGWYNINDQGVNIDFYVVEFRGANTKVFDFQAGGFMIARHVLSAYANSILLNIGLGGKLKTGPGKNNGFFKLVDVKTDTEATTGAHIVYMEGDSGDELNRWCHIIVDGGANSRRANDTATDEAKNKFMRIVGRCGLTISELDFPGQIEIVGGDPGSSYAGSTFSPDILLNRCQLLEGDADDLTRIIIGDTPNSVQLDNCFYNTGTTAAVDRAAPVQDYPIVKSSVAVPHLGLYVP